MFNNRCPTSKICIHTWASTKLARHSSAKEKLSQSYNQKFLCPHWSM